MQKGAKVFGKKGKLLAMKETTNIGIKNDCVGELDFDSLTLKIEDKAFSLLIFMVMKRSSNLKSR